MPPVKNDDLLGLTGYEDYGLPHIVQGNLKRGLSADLGLKAISSQQAARSNQQAAISNQQSAVSQVAVAVARSSRQEQSSGAVVRSSCQEQSSDHLSILNNPADC